MPEVASGWVSVYPKLANGFASTLKADMRKEMAAVGEDKAGAEAFTKQGKYRASKFADGFKSALGPVFAAASVGAAAQFVKGMVDDFSELEDVTAAAGETFGNSLDIIKQKSEGAASALGISKRQYIDGALTMGVFGKSAGLAGDDLANFSAKLVQTAGDMASFRGTTPEEAIEAVGAALRGESEPIRKYGVLLDDATLKARAMKMGLISTTKDALTPANKVLAAQAEILAQTTDAQGDFARTAGSTANVQKTLLANMENLRAEIGEKLAPVLVEGTKALSDLMGTAKDSAGSIQPTIDVFRGLATAISDVTAASKDQEGLGPLLKLLQDASGLTWAQGAANAYMASESRKAGEEVEGLSDALHIGIGTTRDNTAATEDNADAAERARAEQKKLAEALMAVYRAQLTVRGDSRALEAAYDDARDGLKEYREELVEKYKDDGKSEKQAKKLADEEYARWIKSGDALAIHTEAGRRNQDALDGIAAAALGVKESMEKANVPADKVAATMDKAREEFIDTARQMGVSKKRAEELADSLGLIKSKDVDVNVHVKWKGDLNKTWSAGGQGHVKFGLATGGPVFGPGSGTSDSIPAWLSNGEHVLTADDVRDLGGQDAVYRMRRMAQSGRLKFAEGGAVGPVSGIGGIAPVIYAPITVQGDTDPLGAARRIEEHLVSLQQSRGVRPATGKGLKFQ